MIRVLTTAALIFCLLGQSSGLSACTFFLIARDGVVLAGNNEDYLDPDTWVWFEPAGKGHHGGIYFGFGNGFHQGGMNDQGLFFDGAACRDLAVTRDPEKPPYLGNPIVGIMQSCSTVEEVIAFWQRYQVPDFMRKAQLQFGDAKGDSVILEGDAVIRKQGDFQVTTNFYQSQVAQDEPKPCWRYNKAVELLTAMEKPDVSQVASVLAATRQEGKVSTMYSNVYDLKRKRIHLYHFHDFTHEVVLDLEQELAKGKRSVKLPSLFPESFAFRRYCQERKQDQ